MSILATTAASKAAVSGLVPYAGPWGREQAAHLLRRTLFGPKKAEISESVNLGLGGTLDQLLSTPRQPSPPLNHFFSGDSNVPVGQSWINAPHGSGFDVGRYRNPSLRGWFWQNLLHHDFNIMARMTMFWVNHFGIADIEEQRAEYQSIQLFNEFGTDNFQRMIERVTVNTGMLIFLNGQYSNRWDPNENYGRELLELFTIQRGPQVSLGDYTYYTEEDIPPIARILTGWRIRGMWSNTIGDLESWFDESWHDPDPKQLSHRFDNVVINNTENPEEEYKELIQLIFKKAQTAKSFCEQLYRFFVYFDITEEVDVEVIDPLAQVLIDNNYDIKPTLRALFSSQHFYDISVRGPLIKSPYDFVASMARPLGGFSHLDLDLSDNSENNPLLRSCYSLGFAHHERAYNMGMSFLDPPSVAGWKAYYQEPVYYRTWIGSSTLKHRKALVDDYTGDGIETETENEFDFEARPFDYFGFVASLEAPSDPNELVAESAQIFLPRELHPDQLDALKRELTAGLADEEWVRQYEDYLANPFNSDVVNPVLNKLKNFFRALFSMAEFHLM
ncbi:MAG: DUF1800 family protein [Lewinella sp.]